MGQGTLVIQRACNLVDSMYLNMASQIRNCSLEEREA